jgi:peptidoglycan hydrolase CwlO-like protein
MAKPADNLRDAVERTVDATLGSAERSRSVAQGALEDLRRSVSDAIEGRRPATSDDVKELKAELRAINRRLDKIEERLPKKRSSSSKRSS